MTKIYKTCRKCRKFFHLKKIHITDLYHFIETEENICEKCMENEN